MLRLLWESCSCSIEASPASILAGSCGRQRRSVGYYVPRDSITRYACIGCALHAGHSINLISSHGSTNTSISLRRTSKRQTRHGKSILSFQTRTPYSPPVSLDSSHVRVSLECPSPRKHSYQISLLSCASSHAPEQHLADLASRDPSSHILVSASHAEPR